MFFSFISTGIKNYHTLLKPPDLSFRVVCSKLISSLVFKEVSLYVAPAALVLVLNLFQPQCESWENWCRLSSQG